jgi:hypothetical protein
VTTRALVKSSAFNHDRARANLRDRACSAAATVGGRDVRLFVEPLLAEDASGGLLQAVRIEVAAGVHPDAEVIFATRGGTRLPTSRRAGPRGSLRVLVPAVEEPTPVSVTIPALDPTVAVDVTLTPQRRWTVHLVHHSHLDIGYTDPQGTVLAEHLSFLDSALDLTRATDDFPEASQFRWAVEALLSFRQWEKARPAARVAEFVNRVREGRIELTAMPYNLHTEACSTDELFEMLRVAKDVRDRHGIGFTSAMQTDVPGSTIGQIDALAQMGVKYLSVGHNWAGRSVPHLTGGQDLPRLFRWKAPSGNSVLVWVTDTPHGLAYMEGPMLGFDTSYDAVDDFFPAYLESLATHPYPFDGTVFGWPVPDAPLHRKPYPWDILHLRVQGHFADNAPPRVIMAETARRWNEEWAYPKMRLSRNEDFFVDAEERLAGPIETFEGDWTDWWVEGIGSGARPVAMSRRAQGAVSDAQTVGTMAGLLGADGAAADSRDASISYDAMSLFDEHTWGASNAWTDGDTGMNSGDQQWHWKYGQALTAHDESLALLDRASARLGSRLTQAEGTLASFYVVNTVNWSRTDRVRCFLPESLVPLEVPVQVYDARTKTVLAHDEEPQINPNHRDAGRFLVVLVPDAPEAGMVRLDVVTADGPAGHTATAATRADPAGAPVLENEFLRVQVDLARSAITSIVDKTTGRELVAAESTVGFGGYVYDRYASAGMANHQANKLEGNERLDLLGGRDAAGPSVVLARTTSETAQTLTYSTFAPGARSLATTLTLVHGVGRLDITHRLSKAATMSKESAYIAFPFDMATPTVRAEVTGGVVGTGIPLVPGGARHMRAVRRWVTMADDDYAIAWSTIDAPLVQFETITLPYAPFPDTTEPREPGTLYSWIHNNLWDTNFPSQQGFEMDFRYSVAGARPTRALPAESLGMRTAAATSRPLHAVLARGGTESAGTLAPETSFFTVDDPRIRLVGATTEPDGGVLLRLQSVAQEPVAARITSSLPIRSAREATWIGDPGDRLETEAGTVVITVPTAGTAGLLLEAADVADAGRQAR